MYVYFIINDYMYVYVYVYMYMYAYVLMIICTTCIVS